MLKSTAHIYMCIYIEYNINEHNIYIYINLGFSNLNESINKLYLAIYDTTFIKVANHTHTHTHTQVCVPMENENQLIVKNKCNV